MISDYQFRVFYENEPTAEVRITDDHKRVEYHVFVDREKVENHTKIPFVFDNPTLDNIYDFLESRCMPKERTCMEQYLSDLGLDEYNPYKIVQVTHGVMWEDNLWLKFPGDTVTWDDVRVR